jgi:hypothetical protein
MPTAANGHGDLLPIVRPKKHGSVEREFPLVLRPPERPAGRSRRPPKKKTKPKPKVVTFKCPTDLLEAVDLCVDALREWDPLASRGTVLRMALTSFLGPRGFIEKVNR